MKEFKIQALVFDGFDELDILGVYEPLKMAGMDIQIISLNGQKTVKGANGLQICVENIFDLQNKPNILVVPGGGWIARSKQGAWAEAKDGTILSFLQECYQAGVVLAAVCTGVMLLAKAGLLKGRNAITNHSALEELRAEGANIVLSSRVVDEGQIITAGGIISSLDLGLWLIERFHSKEKALMISDQLEFTARGPVWQKSNI